IGHCREPPGKLCPNGHVVTIALPGVIGQLLLAIVEYGRHHAMSAHHGYFFWAMVRPSPIESIASSTRSSARTYSLKSLIARASGSGSGLKIRPCRKVL